MPKKLDATSLAGRIFTSPSGNSGRIEVMELGAARVIWKRKPSMEDLSTLNQWMAKELAVGIIAKNHLAGRIGETDKGKEEAALRRWEKELGQED